MTKTELFDRLLTKMTAPFYISSRTGEKKSMMRHHIVAVAALVWDVLEEELGVKWPANAYKESVETYPLNVCIDLYNLQHGDGSHNNFSLRLLSLLAKSDVVNYSKIRDGWPDLVRVWERWHDHEDGEEWLLNRIRNPATK